ncbi:MAG: cache domain-containing protein [bacterium]|nr:cache domain-containing protein [bacterium]
MKKIYLLILIMCLLTTRGFAEETAITASMPSEEIGDALSAKAQSTAEKIKQIISERGKDLLILSKGITSFGQAGRQEWAKGIVSFSKEFKDYSLIRIINTRGVEEMKVAYGREIKSGYADVSSDEFFKECIKLNKDQISVSSLEFNSEGVVVLRMSTPIYGLSGMEKAILSFDWDISEITELIKKLKVSDASYGFIINPEGKILVHPEKSKMLKEKLETDINPEYKAIAQRMQLGESGWGKYNLQDKEYIIGFYFYPELDWSVGISYLRGDKVADAGEAQANISPSVSVQATEPVKQITQELKPVQAVVPVVLAQSEALPLSALSLKILKGSLRSRNIENFKANIKIEGKISPELTNTIILKLQGVHSNPSEHLLALWKINENSYKQFRWEITSPDLMAEVRVLNENESFIYYPLEKKLMMFNKEDFIEYFKINSGKENKMLLPLQSIDIENYCNDKIDMQTENDKMFYVLEMDMKTPLEYFGVSLKRVKMKIGNEYFLPVLIEWYTGEKEKIVSASMEDYNINTDSSMDFSYLPKPDDNIVKYQDVKAQLLKEAGLSVEPKKENEVQLNSSTVKGLLQEEIKKRGLITARILASGSNNFILNKNIEELKNVLLSVWSEDWVDYIAILDNEGKKVIQTGVKESLKNDEVTVRYQREELSVPVIYQGRPVGSVKIGVNLEKADYILKEFLKGK